MGGSWSSKLALLACSSAVALVVAEVVVRAWRLAPTSGIRLVDAETFERIPGIFMPSRTWVQVGPLVPFDATIDALGYRGAAAHAVAPPDALRILFVGDSFVFGVGVEDGETWPAQLERALRCGPTVVVYNAGVPGGSLPESIAMADRARELHPDAIVVEFTASNDVPGMIGSTYWSQMEGRRRAGRLHDAALRMMAHLGLWNLAREERDAFRNRSLASASPEETAAARDRYAAMLEAWAARLRGEGTPLVFAAYPSLEMIASGDRGLHDWALATARRAGLDPIDLWPVLARDGQAADELYLVPRDPHHPTRAGYGLAARATAAAIRMQFPAFEACRVE